MTSTGNNGSRRRMSMQVVSSVQKVLTSAPKHNSAPPSAGGRRGTIAAVSDRKLSLASNTSEGRKRSARKFILMNLIYCNIHLAGHCIL